MRGSFLTMATSAARIAANRLNCLHSTGPKTAEGKAVSRLNAFKHGMAGRGDIPMPGEDEAEIARRAGAFGRELGASGDMGRYLANRMAVLTVRVERSSDRELTLSTANQAAAGAEFDADLARDIDGWIDALGGDDPRPAVVELEAWPDGVARLMSAWRDLRSVVETGDATARAAALARAGRWLSLDEGAPVTPPAALLDRISRELDRLAALGDRQSGSRAALDIARREAIARAGFDAGPEATLARRYEATAERGVYQAIRAIRALTPATTPTTDRAESPATAPNLSFASLPRDLRHLVPPATAAELAAPLASFRVGQTSPPATAPEPPTHPQPLSPDPTEHRKNRPDVRKLQQKMHANRR